MGNRAYMDADTYPAQSSDVGSRTDVCFRYDTSRCFPGTVIRDDVVDPYTTIIQLDNGRVVLAEECQYSVPRKPETTP